MPVESNANSVIEFSSAGYLLGPFFFAVFFMLVICSTAHLWYSKVQNRTSPPASETEKSTYRTFFLMSFGFGIVLVSVSVGWWIYSNWKDHSFNWVVVGVEVDQSLVAGEDNFYFREGTRNLGPASVRDYYFAVVKSGPFSAGQTFTLKYYPNTGSLGPEKPKAVDLEVPYSGLSSPRFKIQAGPGNKFKLIPIGFASKGESDHG
jgi:hypothetical protein